MIFERYSGSDKTDVVSRNITRMMFLAEESQKQLSNDLLLKCLKIEEDPNWRGYLKYYLGFNYVELDNIDLGKRALNDAMDRFDQFASNFRDVEIQYAMTLMELAKHETEIDARLEYVLRTIPYYRQVEEYFRDHGHWDSLWQIADVLYEKAISSEEEMYYSLSLEFYIKIHRMFPENMYALEKIAYSYYGLNEPDDTKRVFAAWEKIGNAVGFEHSSGKKFLEWMYSAFPDLLQECIAAGVDGNQNK